MPKVKTVDSMPTVGLVPVVHVLGHAIEDPINAEAVIGALAPVAVLRFSSERLNGRGPGVGCQAKQSLELPSSVWVYRLAEARRCALKCERRGEKKHP